MPSFIQSLKIFSFLLFIALSTISKAQIVLPFIEKGDLVVVNLSINNLKGEFIFDTGASNTVLDSAVATKLGLKAEGTNRNSSTGGSANFNYISNQKISLNKENEIICKKIIFTNLNSLQELVGAEFVGIIGYDILKNYITKIDYEAQTISLYTQLNKTETRTYTSISFNFNNGIPIPQFDVSFTLNNGEKFTGPILFDSGAAATLMVNTPFKEKNQIANKIGKTITYQGQDLFKENKLEQGGIKSIQMGTYMFDNLPVTLTSTKAGVNSFSYYLGILGNKVINRFNVIIDYSTKVIYFKPNKNFGLPFEYMLSGVRFKKVKNQIQIAYVVVGTEAEKLGLKKDDHIVSVDGYTGNDMEVMRKLIQQEGKTIKIAAKGVDGKVKEISLLLKKLI
ncbi:aspartyl protease family protein [Pedobacter sp. Du54]|uniref:aspartyl protease family protein n=1 Tax=Pedobacter anseongensis TaxID=3133439 RepID=UPI0030AE5C0F